MRTRRRAGRLAARRRIESHKKKWEQRLITPGHALVSHIAARALDSGHGQDRDRELNEERGAVEETGDTRESRVT